MIWVSLFSYTEIITFLVLKLCVTEIDDWLSKEDVTVATWDTSTAGKFISWEPSPLKKEAVIAPIAKLIDWLTNELTTWDEPETTPSPLVFIYRVSKEDVNCDEPDTIPAGIEEIPE